MIADEIKLTQYSHGAGCGCKIAPGVLEHILNTNGFTFHDPRLLVGNLTKDDAAVYDLEDGKAVISTTDFFMPIVDDPSDFGGIASVNAISDIYAMGGKPIMAIAILGWPIDRLSGDVANKVLAGSRKACAEAGIALAGGHSIDSPEPIYGLAVTGIVDKVNIKQNDRARLDSLLYLSKPLGVGILSTAQKQGRIAPEHLEIARNSMLKLNKVGQRLGQYSWISAMTDVTGFGLLGHLVEICEGSECSAEINFEQVPVIPEARQYLDMGCVPGGTHRNWESYGDKIGPLNDNQRLILTDPQTSGGLLIAVDPDQQEKFEAIMEEEGYAISPIGKLTPEKDRRVIIN